MPAQRVASALMSARRSALEALALAGAVVLRVTAGVGFANYDTLYALAWGGQLSRGDLPAYSVAIAPTPHPLVELLGVVLSPLGPSAVDHVTVALGFIALSACGWVIYRLGAHWFGWAAGALAALIFLTRVPVLSYGVRAYVDLPYLLFVLSALLVEVRGRAPLARARARAARARRAAASRGLGVLRALLAVPDPLLSAAPARADPWRLTAARRLSAADVDAQRPAHHRRAAVVADQHPPHRLHARRATGIANVPSTYRGGSARSCARPCSSAPRSAACSRCSGCAAARSSAPPPACSPSLVFAAFATAGLPINTRYAFLASAILAIFCGAGVFGWTRLPRGDRAGAGGSPAGCSCSPRWSSTHPRSIAPHIANWTNSPASSRSKATSALADDTIGLLRCGPIGVPNHAPVPLLALYLEDQPRQHRQPRSRPHLHRRLRPTRPAARSNGTTCSTRATPRATRAVPPASPSGRQPLVAGLRAVLR